MEPLSHRLARAFIDKYASKIFGKPFEDMCDLMDERFPNDDPCGIIILRGMDRLTNVFLVMGIIIGISAVLSLEVLLYIWFILIPSM